MASHRIKPSMASFILISFLSWQVQSQHFSSTSNDNICGCLQLNRPLAKCFHLRAFTRNDSHLVMIDDAEYLYVIRESSIDLSARPPKIYLYDQRDLVEADYWFNIPWFKSKVAHYSPLIYYGIYLEPGNKEGGDDPETSNFTKNSPDRFSTLEHFVLNDPAHPNLVLRDGHRLDTTPPNAVLFSLVNQHSKFSTVVNGHNEDGYFIRKSGNDGAVQFYDLQSVMYKAENAPEPKTYTLKQIDRHRAKFVSESHQHHGDFPDLVSSSLDSLQPVGLVAKSTVLLLDFSAERAFIFPYRPIDSDHDPFPVTNMSLRDLFQCQSRQSFRSSQNEAHRFAHWTIIMLGLVVFSFVASGALLYLNYSAPRRESLQHIVEGKHAVNAHALKLNGAPLTHGHKLGRHQPAAQYRLHNDHLHLLHQQGPSIILTSPKSDRSVPKVRVSAAGGEGGHHSTGSNQSSGHGPHHLNSQKTANSTSVSI